MPTRSQAAPGPLAVALATAAGNLFLVLGTLVLAVVALAIGWLPPRGDLIYRVARLWSRGVLRASGVRVEVDSHPGLAPGGQYVFMANHQSLMDIPALIATLPGQTRFLAKRSLFWIPFFGWAIKLGGFVTIDRKDLRRARAGFSDAARRLRTGVSVLVFPEGTRSRDGRLLPFRRGGFLLALRSGLAIVPVGLRGSRAVRHRDSYVIRPGTITVRYGAPLAAEEYGLRRKRELVAAVRERIAELSGASDSGVPETSEEV